MTIELIHDADRHSFKDGAYGLTCIRLVSRHYIITRHHDGIAVHVTGAIAAELTGVLERAYQTAAERGLRSSHPEPERVSKSAAAYRIIDQLYVMPAFTSALSAPAEG